MSEVIHRHMSDLLGGGFHVIIIFINFLLFAILVHLYTFVPFCSALFCIHMAVLQPCPGKPQGHGRFLDLSCSGVSPGSPKLLKESISKMLSGFKMIY